MPMGSTVPHDEESARRYLNETRGPREAANLIDHADTRAALIQTASRLNYWSAEQERMRAARKVAHVLYPGEDIPPPERGRQPDDLALFARVMLKFGAALSAQLTARELMAVALVVEMEPAPRCFESPRTDIKDWQREEWTATTSRKWEVLHTRNSP